MTKREGAASKCISQINCFLLCVCVFRYKSTAQARPNRLVENTEMQINFISFILCISFILFLGFRFPLLSSVIFSLSLLAGCPAARLLKTHSFSCWKKMKDRNFTQLARVLSISLGLWDALAHFVNVWRLAAWWCTASNRLILCLLAHFRPPKSHFLERSEKLQIKYKQLQQKALLLFLFLLSLAVQLYYCIVCTSPHRFSRRCNTNTATTC